MERALQILNAVALLSVAFACIAIGAMAMHVGYSVPDFKPTVTHANASLDSADTKAAAFATAATEVLTQLKGEIAKIGPILAEVHKTTKAINDPRPTRGTLNLINKDIVDAGDLTKRADQALDHTMITTDKESAMLDKWNVQITSTLDGTNRMVDAGTSALSSANKLFADPNIPKLTANAVAITGTGAHMLFTADAVETKGTKSYLHPSSNPFIRTGEAIKPFLVPTAQVVAAIALH